MLLTIDVPDATRTLSATIIVAEKDSTLTVTSRVFGVCNGELQDETGKNKITLQKKEDKR